MDAVYRPTTKQAKASEFFHSYIYTKRVMSLLALGFFICFVSSMVFKNHHISKRSVRSIDLENLTPIDIPSNGPTTLHIHCANPCVQAQERERGRKKYVLKHTQVNWYRAMELCIAEGKRLATVMNEDESDQLKELLGETRGKFWLGGSDLAEEGKFVWLSTGKPMTYQDWAAQETAQPDNHLGKEHCLEVVKHSIQGWSWNDYDCKRESPFVCEYNKDFK